MLHGAFRADHGQPDGEGGAVVRGEIGIGELGEKDIKVGLIEPGFTGADFHYPEFPSEKQRELIHPDLMLRAEDIAVAAHFMLTQPRRTAVSRMRVETRRAQP